MLIFEKELGKLSGYTVVLPAVSVGNAGQLCVDVLLENIAKDKMTSTQILHPSIVPIVGPDPLRIDGVDNSAVLTAMQAYTVVEKSIVIFQLRSGILPGKGAAFIADFLQWFQAADCKDLIVIGSMHAHERIDVQITGTPLRYLNTTTSTRKIPDQFVPLESREEQSTGFMQNDNDTASETGPIIPGGGISSRVYQSCQLKGISATLMLKFCSEGDNRTDGLALSDYFNQVVNVMPKSSDKTKVPASWRYLFGGSAPVQMFW